jgi:hypothetical protein
MAPTLIANIIDPEVLADQISAKFPDKLVFANSGLVDVNTTFPLSSPGTKFTIPFWKRIGAFGALTENSAMATSNVTTDTEQATVLRGGAAYEVTDMAALVSIPDPMAEISNQIARRAAEYIDAKLVTEVEKSPNTYDITSTGTGKFDSKTIVAAVTSLLGDNFAKVMQGGAVVMHSKVYGDLLQTDAIQNNYQSGMDAVKNGMIAMISGLPIIISDRVTVSAVSTVNQYKTYVVAPGALGLFYQRQVKVEFDRDILKQNDLIAATVHFAPHLNTNGVYHLEEW